MALLALITACGGGGSGDSSDSSASSTYITFAGSVNGESVVDANNEFVKFLATSRSMETASKSPSDITLDSSNNIVQGGNRVIGSVRLIAGTNNTTIAGMVATNGTMLAVNTAAGTSSLGSTTVTFAAPGGGTGTGTTKGIRPTLSWQVSVSQAFNTYVLQLCYGGNSCNAVGASITRDVNLSDTITSSGFADGIRWSASSPVQTATLNDLTARLDAVLTTVWSGSSTPSGAVVESVFNTALANGDGTADVASRALAAFARAGYPTTAIGGTATGGLAGTWCADVSGNQNCWVFDSATTSTTGSFYQQSINQYAGTLTNTMTWSANTTAKTLTYRFTYSKLTNSASNYEQPINGSTYTFGYTLSGTTFTFQGINFLKQ